MAGAAPATLAVELRTYGTDLGPELPFVSFTFQVELRALWQRRLNLEH
jgi:hypothetical protein